jgi:hypothetical protein
VVAGIHTLGTIVWAGIAGGAAAGFLARDLLGLGQPLVALAWVVGATLMMLPLARARSRRGSGRARSRRRSGRAGSRRS